MILVVKIAYFHLSTRRDCVRMGHVIPWLVKLLKNHYADMQHPLTTHMMKKNQDT